MGAFAGQPYKTNAKGPLRFPFPVIHFRDFLLAKKPRRRLFVRQMKLPNSALGRLAGQRKHPAARFSPTHRESHL